MNGKQFSFTANSETKPHDLYSLTPPYNTYNKIGNVSRLLSVQPLLRPADLERLKQSTISSNRRANHTTIKLHSKSSSSSSSNPTSASLKPPSSTSSASSRVKSSRNAAPGLVKKPSSSSLNTVRSPPIANANLLNPPNSSINNGNNYNTNKHLSKDRKKPTKQIINPTGATGTAVEEEKWRRYVEVYKNVNLISNRILELTEKIMEANNESSEESITGGGGREEAGSEHEEPEEKKSRMTELRRIYNEKRNIQRSYIKELIALHKSLTLDSKPYNSNNSNNNNNNSMNNNGNAIIQNGIEGDLGAVNNGGNVNTSEDDSMEQGEMIEDNNNSNVSNINNNSTSSNNNSTNSNNSINSGINTSGNGLNVSEEAVNNGNVNNGSEGIEGGDSEEESDSESEEDDEEGDEEVEEERGFMPTSTTTTTTTNTGIQDV